MAEIILFLMREYSEPAKEDSLYDISHIYCPHIYIGSEKRRPTAAKLLVHCVSHRNYLKVNVFRSHMVK